MTIYNDRNHLRENLAVKIRTTWIKEDKRDGSKHKESRIAADLIIDHLVDHWGLEFNPIDDENTEEENE